MTDLKQADIAYWQGRQAWADHVERELDTATYTGHHAMPPPPIAAPRNPYDGHQWLARYAWNRGLADAQKGRTP